MRVNIFKKAEELKNKVISEGSARDRLYFSFEIDDPPQVCLAMNGKFSYLESCTCSCHSIFGGITDMNTLWTYVLGVYNSIK